MANSKKRRKILIFSVIGIALIALTAGAILRKREVVITVQTEKVARHNLTEIVVANGKIQPVVHAQISPEVSGEIIDLPVKEGQLVNRGDLILKIKPDFYAAQRNQAEASYKSSLAGQATAEANLHKAEAEYRRNQGLFSQKLVSESIFDEVKAAYEVGQANCTSAMHQVEMAKASLDSADEQLAKTTIVSPLTGTVSKLNSQLGERVLGTVQNVGTDVMTISDLNEMEARVDIGEIDVVLIAVGQTVRLEVDAFNFRFYTAAATEIANSSGAAGLSALAQSSSSSQQEATKFGVKIRIKEKEPFRPGMSVTAEIETRYRTNSLTVPIASVTTRLPKDKSDKSKKGEAKNELTVNASTNATAASTNSSTSKTNAITADNNNTNSNKGDKKSKKAAKPIEVVFIADSKQTKMVPVKISISDDSYWKIVKKLKEDDEVVSGGYRAIGRDLEDGKKIKKGVPELAKDEKQEKAN